MMFVIIAICRSKRGWWDCDSQHIIRVRRRRGGVRKQGGSMDADNINEVRQRKEVLDTPQRVLASLYIVRNTNGLRAAPRRIT